MSKSKVLNVLVILLIITNLVALGFFFISKRKHSSRHKRPNPKEVIIKNLQMDEEQVIKFEDLIKEHSFEMDKYTSEIRQSKQNLFLGLSDSTINSDSLIKQINTIQLRIEHIQYEHFKDIKKICKPSQMEAFEELSKKMGRLFSPPGKPMQRRKNH